MLKIEYTSTALRGEDCQEKVEAAKQFCEERGAEFGVQVHNTADKEEVLKVVALDLPLSFHAPVMGDYLLNLAAEDFSPAVESMKTNVEWMRKLGVNKAVFHAFMMIDPPIPAFGRGRPFMESFKKLFRTELALPDSTNNRDFYDIPEYHERFPRVIERLGWFREKYPDLTFLVENDYPVSSCGLVFPEHLEKIPGPLCLDVAHAWASANIHDRPYMEMIDGFLATGRVEMVHLHASPFMPGSPKETWSDGHKPLSIPNAMELPRVITACRAHEIENFILEVIDASVEDIQIFFKMWQNAE